MTHGSEWWWIADDYSETSQAVKSQTHTAWKESFVSLAIGERRTKEWETNDGSILLKSSKCSKACDLRVSPAVYPWAQPNQCSDFKKIIEILGCARCRSWVLRSCHIKIRVLFMASAASFSRCCVHALEAQDISFDSAGHWCCSRSEL